ncbi:hypothetical protein V8B97DRAFT_1916743 [Scleroderma yunnanense]
MLWLTVLALPLLIMTNLACPSCGKTVKGEAGLLVHVSCWCCKNQSNLASVLQQHCEHVQTMAKEERRRLHLEAEKEAESVCLEQEQDALHAVTCQLAEPCGLPAHNCHPPQHYYDDPPALSIPVLTPAVAEDLEFLTEEGALMDDINMNLGVNPISTSQQSSAQGPPAFVHTHSDGNDFLTISVMV